jgi:hypothetical protein
MSTRLPLTPLALKTDAALLAFSCSRDDTAELDLLVLVEDDVDLVEELVDDVVDAWVEELEAPAEVDDAGLVALVG